MTEPLSNIARVCKSCASKPGKYTGQAPEGFVGKFIKLGFPAVDRGRLTSEHMWVHVRGLHEEGLTGVVSNDPILECDYHNGDTVAFAVSEIEDVLDR